MRVACLAFHQDLELERIAEAFLNWSPQISLSRERAVFVEIGKCRQILTEAEFLTEARIFLQKLNVQAEIAIGNDVAQALAFARYVPESVRAPELGDLPVQSLRELTFPYGSDSETTCALDHMLHALLQVGVRTVGEFCHLPPAEFSSRFGKLGLLCRLRVEQGCAELWQNWQPRERVIESLDLDERTCPALEPLIFLCKQLLDCMFLRLRGLGLSLSSLGVALKFENLSIVRHKTRSWKIDFTLAQTDAKGVLAILRERLERDFARTPLEAQITALRLEAIETTQNYDGQRAFFSQQNEERERLAAVLAHLAECVGKEKVFQAGVSEDRFPEKSWRKFNRWVATDIDIKNAYPERPLRLLTRPLRLQITAEMIFLGQRGFRVVDWSSVERLSGHWLDGLEIRNYYKINIQNGPPLWIFQDSEDRHFLHGYYE